MDQNLPAHVRPRMFALNELMFDLLHVTRSYLQIDMESLLIFLCVNDATMRPFMTAGPAPDSKRVPEELRGSISRRMIADKTGLPRETVRRKVKELADASLLIIDSDDRIRSAARLEDADVQRTIDDAHKAVAQYWRKVGS